jgi:hypothetical protein
MLKSKKSQLTCSYCSIIFKDPILLPCDDSICREHLKDRDVVKQSKIKCKKCNEEFGVRNNQFKSSNELKKFLDSHSYSFACHGIVRLRGFLYLKRERMNEYMDIEIYATKFAFSF